MLAFEQGNRGYFATMISDRGEEYFEQFTERFDALLAEQVSGVGAYYVLLAADGSVLGRFNLIFGDEGIATLGYRVAEQVAGLGVATATVRELCLLAASRHRLRTLEAGTPEANVASRRVLLKAGFVETGPADPARLGGKSGSWFVRDLAAD